MKLLASSIGLLLVFLGVIMLFSPIPIGILLFASGTAILVCVNDKARDTIYRLRSSNHRINKQIVMIEEKLEKRFKKLHFHLIKTRPMIDNKFKSID